MSRILVVEDAPAVREVVVHALSQEGLKTAAAVATNGARNRSKRLRLAAAGLRENFRNSS